MKNAHAPQLCYRTAVVIVPLEFVVSSAQTPNPVRQSEGALRRQVDDAATREDQRRQDLAGHEPKAELHEENGRKFVPLDHEYK